LRTALHSLCSAVSDSGSLILNRRKPTVSGFGDPGNLIGVHPVSTADGNILAGDEPLLAEAEAYLVVPVAFRIVEIPLSAWLSPQAADAVFPAGGEVP